ncbi:MAG TPA: arginine decarboxylase, pyruvoyl-dependent [Planctomycetota bacterium]|nr:arginine decarboxylase, pyruvoyl-dependent [Planctomycetota bacterium]
MAEGNPFTAREIFLTKGVGIHKERLTSFEMALRKARIACYNLVSVSSIFPPYCKLIPIEKGLKKMRAGQVTFSVMARSETNENRRLISSSIGLAIPKDPAMYGYLSEHHSYGEDEESAGEYAEDLAASMLCTVLGVDYDADASYDERKAIWKISNRIYRTTNITQTAQGAKNGWWTTVLAAAVLVG